MAPDTELDPTRDPSAADALVRQGARSWFVKAGFGIIAYGAYLFVLAGTWRWPSAWAFLILFLAATIAHGYLLVRTNPWLLAQRSKGLHEEGAPKWDKLVTGLAAGLLPLLSWTVAALDFRYDWSAPMAPWIQVVGAIVFVFSWMMVIWATYANRFFTTTVRIQPGHTVQTGGPYRYVRHPGYVGSILYILATPFVLGSWWAVVPAAVGALLMIVRTKLEDDFLQRELDGYSEFAARVRYRLVPGAW